MNRRADASKRGVRHLKPDSSFLAPFLSFWRPNKKEVEAFVQSAIIVLDTNVLLDLYRVTPQARNEILAVLEQTAERIFIPHQVALEFHQNRVKVAKDQLDFYVATRSGLDSLKSQALQKISEFTKRCALPNKEKESLAGPLEEAFKNAVDRIKSHQERFDLDEKKVLNEDPVLARLSILLDGRVGPAFDEAQRSEALKEAARRSSAKIPPGYKDGGKASNSHGDYFLWEQVLTEAARRKAPVLLVSNDNKEDWVHKQLDFAIGPRFELVEEMKTRADAEFRVISFPGFLESVKRKTSIAVSEQTLSEAKMAQHRDTGHSYPTFAGEFPESVISNLWDITIGSLENADRTALAAERALRQLDPSAPEYDRELLSLEAESARRLRDSIKEDVELLEEAIASAQTTDKGIIVKIPTYMRRRVLRLLSAEARSSGEEAAPS
jgi:hypothetical protein